MADALFSPQQELAIILPDLFQAVPTMLVTEPLEFRQNPVLTGFINDRSLDVQVRFNNQIFTVESAEDGTWEFRFQGFLADGTYSVGLQSFNPANNNYSQTGNYPDLIIIDNKPPVVELHTGVISYYDFFIGGSTDTPIASIEVVFQGKSYRGTPQLEGWTVDIPEKVPRGIYEYQAFATDKAGNTGSATGKLLTNPADGSFINLDSGNVINGNSLKNKLKGTPKDDLIYGQAGKDILTGMGGKTDYLDGGDGKDFITGGKGDDILVGGGGKDVLTGGNGLDMFVYRSAKDRGDIIRDFDPIDDRFDLIQVFEGVKFRNGFKQYIKLVKVGSGVSVQLKPPQTIGVGPTYQELAFLPGVDIKSLRASSNFNFIFKEPPASRFE